VAVKDARRAPPQAARSVLDGREHDGTIPAGGRQQCQRAWRPPASIYRWAPSRRGFSPPLTASRDRAGVKAWYRP